MLVQAILDRRSAFLRHSGVDLNGLARAFIRNVSDERMGQGGSTITQQLVKNTYLTPEKTFRRKYAEAMLSLALEDGCRSRTSSRFIATRSTWANAAPHQFAA